MKEDRERERLIDQRNHLMRKMCEDGSRRKGHKVYMYVIRFPIKMPIIDLARDNGLPHSLCYVSYHK